MCKKKLLFYFSYLPFLLRTMHQNKVASLSTLGNAHLVGNPESRSGRGYSYSESICQPCSKAHKRLDHLFLKCGSSYNNPYWLELPSWKHKFCISFWNLFFNRCSTKSLAKSPGYGSVLELCTNTIVLEPSSGRRDRTREAKRFCTRVIHTA